jgi:hypothetical protein
MKNLWPEEFKELDIPAANVLFTEQGRLLEKITRGLVVGEVRDAEPFRLGFDSNDFAFAFNLVGKFANDYRFTLFEFGHDIALYPVKFSLDDALAKELGIRLTTSTSVKSPQELEAFAERIFKSARVNNIVGSIMKLSK